MRYKFLAVILAIGSVGVAQAAEKIRFSDLPSRLAPGGREIDTYSVRVFTEDGTAHAGLRISSGPAGVTVYHKAGQPEEISPATITRIEIRPRKHFFGFSVGSAAAAIFLPWLVCDGDPVCTALTAPVISPLALAVAVGSLPVTLVADGINWLLPPQVYELLP